MRPGSPLWGSASRARCCPSSSRWRPARRRAGSPGSPTTRSCRPTSPARGRLGSARAYLVEMLTTIYAHADDVAPIEVTDRARVRLACTQAIQGAVEVADCAYKAAGLARFSWAGRSSAASATCTRCRSRSRRAAPIRVGRADPARHAVGGVSLRVAKVRQTRHQFPSPPKQPFIGAVQYVVGDDLREDRRTKELLPGVERLRISAFLCSAQMSGIDAVV